MDRYPPLHRLRKPTLLILIFSIAWLAISGVISAQTESTTPHVASRIMEKAVAKLKENESKKRAYLTYHKHRLIEDLEFNPPRQKSRDIFRIFGRNNQSYEALINKDGKEVENGTEYPSTFDLYEAMGNRYEYEMAEPGVQSCDGRICLAIKFKPKPRSTLPFKTREDQVINRISGTIWVDFETHTAYKMEAKLTEEFSKAWGTFRMSIFNLTLEQEETFGILVPKRMVLVLKYHIFGFDTYQRQTFTYSNHRDRRLTAQPPQ